MALYRHQQANFEMFNVVDGLFADPPGIGGLGPGFAGTVRDEDQRTTLDLEIVNHGISGAYRVNDRFSLGLGLSHIDGSLRAITDEYLPNDGTQGAYFAANSFLPDLAFDRALLRPGDDEIHFAMGFGLAFNTFQVDLGADFRTPATRSRSRRSTPSSP